MITRSNLYIYWAQVVRIVDGDTVLVRVDQGLDNTRAITLRLVASTGGVDAPETRTKDLAEKVRGKASEARLAELCPVGSWVFAKTHADEVDGFRRYLTEIYLADGLSNVGDMMLKEGYVIKWMKGR